MLFTLSLISVNIFSSPEYTQLTPTAEISQICCKESMGRLRSRELLLVTLTIVDFIVICYTSCLLLSTLIKILPYETCFVVIIFV